MLELGTLSVLSMALRLAALIKHYHAIIYNLPDSALEPCSSWVKGMALWKKESMINRTINDIWKRGFVTIGELTRKRCGYCAKYFVDKQEVDPILVPNFNLMSRRPGIGLAHVENIKEKVRYFNSTSLLTDNGKYISMPRYYQKKIYSDEERSERWHEHIDEINERFDDLSKLINNDPSRAEEEIIKHLRFGKTKSKI